MHQQCWETWQASGTPATMLKGHHQILDGDDEARLHWWIRNRRWPSFRQSGRQLNGPIKQMRRNFTQIWCTHQRHWEVDKQFVAISSVRVCFFYLQWPFAVCENIVNALYLTSLFSFRYVVLTTSGGIMDHEEARRKHLGGKILGFFF